MRRRYKGAIAALVCGAGLFMGSMKSPGEVYVADTPYDWEDNADSEERYDRSEPMEEAASGPGVVPDAEDPQTAQGPLVTQVSLTEQYHDEYQVYEESINNRFFFRPVIVACFNCISRFLRDLFIRLIGSAAVPYAFRIFVDR